MPSSKNLRSDKPKHSHNFQQFEPKRNGGGGRGCWGNYKNDFKYLYEDLTALDSEDPNYATDEESFVWSSYKPSFQDLKDKNIVDRISASYQFRSSLKQVAVNFMNTGEDEELYGIVESDIPSQFHYEVTRIILSKGLDGTASQRINLLRLLSKMKNSDIISSSSVENGFILLFRSVDDIILDVPMAPDILVEVVDYSMKNELVSNQLGEHLKLSIQYSQDRKLVKKSKEIIDESIREYFESCDLNEIENTIVAQIYPQFHNEFVKRLISFSCDRTNKERELSSELLGELSGSALVSIEVEAGFIKLLESSDSLVVDVPNFSQYLSKFIARAVVDEVLSPSFFSRIILSENDLGVRILKQATSLLQMSHASSRLSRVWGLSSIESVADLKYAISQLVLELHNSRNVDEAVETAKELNVSSFHHEIVKKSFSIALDENDPDLELTKSFFDKLSALNVVSKHQFAKGFDRIHNCLQDLIIDVPECIEVYTNLLQHCVSSGILVESERFLPKIC